jgi:hypothetical protein
MNSIARKGPRDRCGALGPRARDRHRRRPHTDTFTTANVVLYTAVHVGGLAGMVLPMILDAAELSLASRPNATSTTVRSTPAWHVGPRVTLDRSGASLGIFGDF